MNDFNDNYPKQRTGKECKKTDCHRHKNYVAWKCGTSSLNLCVIFTTEKNMNTETETLVNVLRDRMEKMSDESRLELMAALMEGYCGECGSDHLPCYCTRDD